MNTKSMRPALLALLTLSVVLTSCAPVPVPAGDVASTPEETLTPEVETTFAPEPIETETSLPPEASPTEIVTLDYSALTLTPPDSVTPPIGPTPVTIIAPGPITLITLGDSLTAGDGDEAERGGYPGRVLEAISALRPGSTLTNLGASGWNSDALINGDQGLPGQLGQAAALCAQTTAEGRPTIVLVWIGSNDLWYLYEYGGPGEEPADLARFAANMQTILQSLHDCGAAVFVALLDDQSKRPVAIRGEAFPDITPDEFLLMSNQVVAYNQVITDTAARVGAATVDFYSTTLFTDPAALADDGNHPNAPGYDRLTTLWLASVLAVIH